MNYAEVRKLVKLVESSQIQELELEREGTRIRVSKAMGGETVLQAGAQMPMMPAMQPAPMQAPQMPQQPSPATQPAAAAPSESAPVAEPGVSYHEVTSPMVGTFYRASAPDAQPYAKEGDMVKAGQTLCIVEAMKLMNEIECDVDGRVVSIEVENGQPVEFGQVLFKIDTKG